MKCTILVLPVERDKALNASQVLLASIWKDFMNLTECIQPTMSEHAANVMPHWADLHIMHNIFPSVTETSTYSKSSSSSLAIYRYKAAG